MSIFTHLQVGYKSCQHQKSVKIETCKQSLESKLSPSLTYRLSTFLPITVFILLRHKFYMIDHFGLCASFYIGTNTHVRNSSSPGFLNVNSMKGTMMFHVPTNNKF